MIEKTCDVQGHVFELTFEQEGVRTRMRVEALELVDLTLARVVESGVAVGVGRFTEAVEARRGQEWDGDVGFTYPEEDDGIREGFVSIHARGDRSEILEELFRSAALQIARVFREVDAQQAQG